MKRMKRIMSVVLAVCVMFALTACGVGQKEKKDAAVCTIEQNGVTVKMSFDVKGDIITKIKQSSTVSTEGYTEEQVAALKEAIEQAEATYKEIEGAEYSIEETDTEITEKISFSVEGDTLKEVVDKGLLPVQGEAEKLSLKKTMEALEDAGWTVEQK